MSSAQHDGPRQISSPIKYVLYTHYGYRDQDDFNAYQQGASLHDLEGVRYLLGHLRGLNELLTSPGHQGMLVIFYAPGYESFIETLALGPHNRTVSSKQKELGRRRLEFAKSVAAHMRTRFVEENLAERIRFLTAPDLQVILGRVNAISAAEFRRFFLGAQRGIRYDAPKVVEAILRLRLLGNGVPLFRLDHDVIFRGQDIGDLGLFKAIACAVRAYQLRLEDPTVSTFLFSASYNTRAIRYPTAKIDPFEAWSRAFATRVYPALVATPAQVCEISALPDTTPVQKAEKNKRWDAYVKAHVDEALARQFYGLKPKPRALETSGTDGLTSIGAHPLHAVISGALLCLSDGAILDLPPYSNFDTNVMWIDDHLKYSLHRAMNHFTSEEPLYLEPGLSDARLDVSVTKARPAVGDLPAYILYTYLPTLLWGAVMDAWITTDPLLKCRLASLGARSADKWRNARDTQDRAPLPQAMLEALRVGKFPFLQQQQLRQELQSAALKRIEKVRQLWGALRRGRQHTFASYWATGTVEKIFGSSPFSNCQDRLWQGIAPGRPMSAPIRTEDDLSVPMARRLNALINDTITYVDWTLEWPNFIQIVRSIRKGTFIGDITWRVRRNQNTH